MNYPLNHNSWGNEELRAIKKTLDSGIYTYRGKYVKEFEKKLSKIFKTKYAIMVNSGSSANLVAIASLFYKKNKPLKRGDEVIVPALAWSTTYHPLQQFGLKVKLVDIDIDTLNVNVETVMKAVSKKTKLILGVSILGNPVELHKLKSFCNRKKIYLMEDNCESMGATINNKFTGTYGIVNTFSTFFSHHISTIEGGFVLTNDKEIYNLALSLRSHGWTRDNQNSFYMKKYQSMYESYCFVLPGYNLRPNNLFAAAGLEQLKKFNKLLQIRRDNHKVFSKIFENDERFIVQKLVGNSACFSFTFILKKKYINQKNSIIKKLKKLKIEFRQIAGGSFIRHPVKKYYNYSIHKNLKNANYVHDHGFFVGNHCRPLTKELSLLKKALKN